MPSATLANWRTAPHNVWSFRHVDELIPTAPIKHGAVAPLSTGPALDTHGVTVPFEGRDWSVAEILTATEGDGLLILQDGKVVHESYRNGSAADRHILFSVSKSVTACLAGVLAGDGALDVSAPVVRYVPEVADTGYGSATVRNVLDMTVNVPFVEDYLDTEGAFARYRAATGWNPPNPKFGSEGLHGFLATMPRGAGAHGQVFHYVSPTTDLLGWILERAGGETFATQLSKRLWQPLGAERDAYVTVDGHGGSRTAGGICTTLRDLGRFGEMMRCDGAAGGRQIVPASWIADMWANGDPAAWLRGSMVELFPRGRYRSKWYISDNDDPALCAIGIHGQWIHIKPRSKTVIVKLSSQRDPLDYRIDRLNFALFEALAARFG